MKESKDFKMAVRDFGSREDVDGSGGIADTTVGRPWACSVRRRVSPASGTSTVGLSRKRT